jgi:hypothetical protein
LHSNKVQDRLTRLRRNIFDHLKSRALDYEQHFNRDLKRYQKDQAKSATRPYTPSNHNELIEQVTHTDIVYMGDFHTFDQNARSVIRILRQLIKQNKDICLALEMIDATKQYAIDAFMENHITELEFLDEINYHNSWRFPWIHYKELFEMAKEHKIHLYGINKQGSSLQERDEFAANQLYHLKKIFPTNILVVVYGELHIVENKIPRMVREKDATLSQTIIHQNLDEIYWQQVEQRTQHNVLKFNNNEFCIQSAPPWIKYESMVYWYENLINDPDFDIHEYIIENGKKLFGEDVHDNFYQIIEETLKLVRIQIPSNNLDVFNLYDHTGLDYIEDYIEENYSDKILEFYNDLITKNYSFKLINSNVIYCSSYSLNRLAYLAGIHLYHLNIADKSNAMKQNIEKGKAPDRFCLFALEALWAHFFSKVFNPHRKCDLYLDLKGKIKSLPALDKGLDVLNAGKFDKLKGMRLFSLYQVATPIGHLLGEHLYEQFVDKMTDQNSISIDQIQEMFQMTPSVKSFNEIRSILLSSKRYKTRRKGLF